jgi:hypothetical protein
MLLASTSDDNQKKKKQRDKKQHRETSQVTERNERNKSGRYECESKQIESHLLLHSHNYNRTPI